MITSIYVVYDKVADETIILGNAKTDGMFIRNNAQFLSRMNPNYLADYDVYCVGTYTDTEKKITACNPRLVLWDAYKTPEEQTPMFTGKIKDTVSPAR